MKQFLLTVAAGKRLIGKGMAVHPEITRVLRSGTLVIIAGTTNSYVVEEIFALKGEKINFPRNKFMRGITLPPLYKTTESGRLPDETGFPGDIVLKNGEWLKGKTVFDIVDDLQEGDVILKGANAINPDRNRAAVLIGHSKAGTTTAAIQAFAGKRVRIIIPAGLEKRVNGDLDDLALRLNAPGIKGSRLLPIPGEVFTEINALALLTGVKAELIAAGGICGAEGSIWVAVSGTPESEQKTENIIKSIANEPAFSL
jgi:hypothetical protein